MSNTQNSDVSDSSRNSWIKKDKPSDVSTMANYKEGYSDILNARKHTHDLDLKFILKSRGEVPCYKYNNFRSSKQLKDSVLQSPRLKHTVDKICQESQQDKEQIMHEAKEIVDEMGHNLHINSVRGLGFFLTKIFKTLFHRIYVNDEGIEQLRHLTREYPVLLMPTHRSYVDFLLMSYVFFHHDLPLPVIAAAMDFQKMKFFGWLLRNCGAFYIRRSFKSDALYWAIFTEYVQSQLRNGDAPLEFFIEGTRSRTSKSYLPKIGMLSAALESYFKAEVPDIMIIPITIDYDRILEEALYAYELLGIPKPKESALGVFKARGILSDKFGCIHMYIGKQISVRQFFHNKVDRSIHNYEPRYINNLTNTEAKQCRDLAYNIVKEHQRHMVISPWCLIATVLAQNRDGISIKSLGKEVEWLKKQACNFGAYVDWPGNANMTDIIHHYINLHSNITSISADGIIKIKSPSLNIKMSIPDVANDLILSMYRNQLLHVFVKVSMLSLTINRSITSKTISKNDLYLGYTFLENIFHNEFIFQPNQSKSDFELALLSLVNNGGIVMSKKDDICVPSSLNKHTTFYSQMFEPFLVGYWLLCQYLLSMTVDAHGRPLSRKPREIAKQCQHLGIEYLHKKFMQHKEVLSLNLLENALSSFTLMNALKMDRRNNEIYLSPNHIEITKISNELCKYIDNPESSAINFSNASDSNITLPAKL